MAYIDPDSSDLAALDIRDNAARLPAIQHDVNTTVTDMLLNLNALLLLPEAGEEPAGLQADWNTAIERVHQQVGELGNVAADLAAFAQSLAQFALTLLQQRDAALQAAHEANSRAKMLQLTADDIYAEVAENVENGLRYEMADALGITHGQADRLINMLIAGPDHPLDPSEWQPEYGFTPEQAAALQNIVRDMLRGTDGR